MRQELNCTECGGHVRFEMDFELDGNHEIKCPECGHLHYRVIKDGQVTDDRWNPNYTVYITTDVTYSIIFGTDPVAVADSNAIAFDTASEASYVLGAANFAVEGEYYWSVDTSYGGDTDKGDVWYFEAIKEIPDVITQPAGAIKFYPDDPLW